MPIIPFTAQPGQLPIGGGRAASYDNPALQGVREVAGNVAKQSEEVLKIKEEDEARSALVQSSEIRAKYAKALDEAATSGGDLDKLREGMANELATVGEGFQTKKGADSLRIYTSNTNLMFNEQSNHIEVQRAYAQAKLDGAKLLKSDSSLIQSNPMYLQIAEQNVDAFVSTFRKVRPEQAAEIKESLKQSLNLSAALAASRADPTATKSRLEAGEWNLTPEQRHHAMNFSDTVISARRSDEAYTRARAKEDENDRDNDGRDSIVRAIVTGTATEKMILDDPRLKATTREHLIVFQKTWAHEKLAGAKVSDPIAKRDLWLAINAPEGDPRKIYNGDKIFEAVAAGKLNTEDATNFNTLVANQRDENGRTVGQRMSQAVGRVGDSVAKDPRYIGQPALIASIQLEYISRIDQKIAEYRKAGKPPESLFDTNNKDGVASFEFIQGAIDAGKQRQQDALPKPLDLRTQKDPNVAALRLAVGAPFLDPKGTPRVMTQKLLDDLKKQPAAAPAAAPAYESFIKQQPRSSNFTLDIPAKSPARSLNGKTYQSRAEAAQALADFYK